jgi:hypothetical protein
LNEVHWPKFSHSCTEIIEEKEGEEKKWRKKETRGKNTT